MHRTICHLLCSRRGCRICRLGGGHAGGCSLPGHRQGESRAGRDHGADAASRHRHPDPGRKRGGSSAQGPRGAGRRGRQRHLLCILWRLLQRPTSGGGARHETTHDARWRCLHLLHFPLAAGHGRGGGAQRRPRHLLPGQGDGRRGPLSLRPDLCRGGFPDPLLPRRLRDAPRVRHRHRELGAVRRCAGLGGGGGPGGRDPGPACRHGGRPARRAGLRREAGYGHARALPGHRHQHQPGAGGAQPRGCVRGLGLVGMHELGRRGTTRGAPGLRLQPPSLARAAFRAGAPLHHAWLPGLPSQTSMRTPAPSHTHAHEHRRF
uniref:Uncharacterized protein n=1 Tax=Auxenochlorella protothecoides TaxID=3075 RepID=A0A1D2A9X0_AUXPR